MSAARLLRLERFRQSGGEVVDFDGGTVVLDLAACSIYPAPSLAPKWLSAKAIDRADCASDHLLGLGESHHVESGCFGLFDMTLRC